MLSFNSTLLLFGVLAILGAERLLELAIDRRHRRALLARGGVLHRDDGFGLILLVQLLLFVLLPLEALLAPWATTGPWTWPLLGVAIAAMALRYWVIATLGTRWSVRVITLPGKDRITGGPYRYLRHPNYVVVALELLVIPAAFGAWGAAAALSALNALALRRRIAREDAALDAAAASALSPRPRGVTDASANRRASAPTPGERDP